MEFLSNHAKKRMQQRGITGECIEQVLIFGKEYYRAGAYVYLATKIATKKMLGKGVPLSLAIRCEGIYVVVHNGKIKTVAHKVKRFKHN